MALAPRASTSAPGGSEAVGGFCRSPPPRGAVPDEPGSVPPLPLFSPPVPWGEARRSSREFTPAHASEPRGRRFIGAARTLSRSRGPDPTPHAPRQCFPEACGSAPPPAGPARHGFWAGPSGLHPVGPRLPPSHAGLPPPTGRFRVPSPSVASAWTPDSRPRSGPDRARKAPMGPASPQPPWTRLGRGTSLEPRDAPLGVTFRRATHFILPRDVPLPPRGRSPVGSPTRRALSRRASTLASGSSPLPPPSSCAVHRLVGASTVLPRGRSLVPWATPVNKAP